MTGIRKYLLLPILAALYAMPAQARTIFVAPNGNDTWTGHLEAPNKKRNDGPFATLTRARNEIRKLKQDGTLPAGGVTVEVRRGIYEMSQDFALEAQDSGTAKAPIEYRARRGEEVRLVGGKVVTGWKPVTDAAILARLEPAARGKVLQTTLRAQGLTDLPGIKGSRSWGQSEPGLELFFQEKPMTLARWPNEGYSPVVDVVGGQPQVNRDPTKADKTGVFVYQGDRPSRWSGEKDIWLHGYWAWDWADQRQKVESIDTAKRVITLAKPDHDFGYRVGQWYYAFNVLAELDRPGEWYLDRESSTLYFWPPAPLANAKTMVSVVPTLVTMRDVSHLTLRGMILEAARGTAITVDGGSQVRISGCTIRNVGSWAVRISGAQQSGVEGCDIYNAGDGGVDLRGGDRKTLVPAKLYADNNHIHHYSRWNPVYQAGVRIEGVGNRISHNLIHDAPHMAIGFNGNDHLIEFNEIHSVCYETNDAGAMYSGANWSMRGNVIRHNYLHHIYGREARGCVGVYLDDNFSSATIYGNVFNKVSQATFIGGGRDNSIDNNIFVDCDPAVHVDGRGLGWRAFGQEELTKKLEEMPYREEPWRSRYPQLLTLLLDEPMAPKGNLIARNIRFGGRWNDFDRESRPYVTEKDNFLEGDPLFVDAARGDFRLRPNSPALKLGFKPIPVQQIGLYKNSMRASWPVRHTVRPKPQTPASAERAQPTGPPPTVSVVRSSAPIIVDGIVAPGEWDNAATIQIEQSGGVKVQPPTTARLTHDGQSLLVLFDNQVSPSKPLRTGGMWGQGDAVEIAVKNLAVGKDAPIMVLRGFAGGKVESSDEAGAPPSVVHKVLAGVEYKATQAGAGRWVAEWRIPFAALGISPALPVELAANLSVRKTATDQWLMWRDTRSSTWKVDDAGRLQLSVK